VRSWTRISIAACALAFAAFTSVAAAAEEIPRTPAPEGARLYFISPTDGETLNGAVTVRFGLAEIGVAPAGVPSPNTGHHHLLVDAELPPFDAAIPNDEQHRHFGGGQTEVRLELTPGRHTLQLLLGDHNHVPHQPPVMSEQIAITVE
jgi:hypothetical protein